MFNFLAFNCRFKSLKANSSRSLGLKASMSIQFQSRASNKLSSEFYSFLTSSSYLPLIHEARWRQLWRRDKLSKWYFPNRRNGTTMEGNRWSLLWLSGHWHLWDLACNIQACLIFFWHLVILSAQSRQSFGASGTFCEEDNQHFKCCTLPGSQPN